MQTPKLPAIRALRPTWNKGRIVGQKPRHVWAIRARLELAENHRDLARFNLAIDSKLRGWDLVQMKVVDVVASPMRFVFVFPALLIAVVQSGSFLDDRLL